MLSKEARAGLHEAPKMLMADGEGADRLLVPCGKPCSEDVRFEDSVDMVLVL